MDAFYKSLFIRSRRLRGGHGWGYTFPSLSVVCCPVPHVFLFSSLFYFPSSLFSQNLHFLWFGTVNNEKTGIPFILHGTYCSNHSTWTCSELHRQSEVFNIFSKLSTGVLPAYALGPQIWLWRGPEFIKHWSRVINLLLCFIILTRKETVRL